ncbi:MAG: Uma2 family endonuclease [Clostridiales bacterium]|mgnify:CR=1 FL=1|nr:Uma2 family endonuclease [Clostridiales bacterium]
MNLAKNIKQKYTYKDYTTWPENERWELIQGIPFNMSPAPSRIHQKILGALHLMFASYLQDKTCEVYLAPFDVRLPDKNEAADDEITNVVQPDLLVVCDTNKLDDRGCKGAPDLIIEITSKSTAKKDMWDKMLLYEKSKVKEYWIVHPLDQTIMVYTLNEEQKYEKPQVFDITDDIKVGILEELTVDVSKIFGVHKPDKQEIK